MGRSGLVRSGAAFAAVVAASAAAALALIGLFFPQAERGGDGRKTRVSYLEARAGELAARAVRQDPALVRDEEINAPVRAVFAAAAAGLPAHPYEFTLLLVESDDPNAFSMPGGVVVVNTALIALMEGPEELAAVFAHELSHALHADAWNSMKASAGLSLALAVLGGGRSGASSYLRDFLRDAAFLNYSRSVESRADAEAASFLAAAGISPRAFARALSSLRAAIPEGANLPELLSSHPDIDARIAEATARAEDYQGPNRPIDVDWQRLRRALPSAFGD